MGFLLTEMCVDSVQIITISLLAWHVLVTVGSKSLRVSDDGKMVCPNITIQYEKNCVVILNHEHNKYVKSKIKKEIITCSVAFYSIPNKQESIK